LAVDIYRDLYEYPCRIFVRTTFVWHSNPNPDPNHNPYSNPKPNPYPTLQ